MPVVEELIRREEDGTISFGNYQLGTKAKKSDFEYFLLKLGHHS